MSPETQDGQCIFNKSKNLAFLQIPKNASTIVRLWGQKPDYLLQFNKNDLQQKHKLVVILRDPVDRYTSAANMFLRFSDNLFHLPIQWNNYLESDKHFNKQVDFIRAPGYDKHTDTDFWYYDSDVIGNILEHYDLSEKNVVYNNNKNPIIKTVHEAPIREYYAEDYELIENTKFINR
jgi:hypothetical protein